MAQDVWVEALQFDEQLVILGLLSLHVVMGMDDDDNWGSDHIRQISMSKHECNVPAFIHAGMTASRPLPAIVKHKIQ